MPLHLLAGFEVLYAGIELSFQRPDHELCSDYALKTPPSSLLNSGFDD